MTPRIRVMVVDDSVVVRRLVTDVLATDPEVEVVCTAPNGKVALQRLEQVPCDLVTLDVEMPELDGIQTLTALRRSHPKLPVIMFSTLTSRAASATIDALSRGANDYVTKPEGVANVAAARERIKADLIPKIKALCAKYHATASSTSTSPWRTTQMVPLVAPSSVSHLAAVASGPVAAVAIGVSTGGPPALQELLSHLPASFPLPIFIVQHMPPTFTTMLAQRLSQTSPMKVVEVVGPTRVEPGKVYLAPGDYHMVVEKTAAGMTLRTNQEAPECSCRPSVDVLFRSIAAAYGPAVLGVVLTGMGSDGTRGAELIRARGGTVIAQDQATSVVWGMPGSVVRQGYAAAVVPIGEMATEIQRRVQSVTRKLAVGEG